MGARVSLLVCGFLAIAIPGLAAGREDGLVRAAAPVSWISDSSGFWDVGTNWSTGNAPQAGDDVVIDRGGASPVITIRTPTNAIATLTANEFLQIDSTLTVTGQAQIAGGMALTSQIAGAGTVQLQSAGTWTGGTIGVAGFTVEAGQTLTISSTNQKVLSGTSLTNNGSVTWTGGVITYDGIATIVNAAGKLWDIQGDLTINGNGNGTQTFTNAGTLRRSSGTGNATMASPVAFTNTGTLEVQTGTFVDTHGGGWTSSGLLSVSNGATINLAGATLQAGTTFAGAGTLTMPGTTVVAANLTVTLPILLTGTLSGAGVLTLGAPMTWSGGWIGPGGGLTVGAGQTLTISSTNQKVLSGTSLTNNGSVTWTGGVITYDGIATIVNAAGKLWDIQGDLTINGNGNGTQTFTNAGTLRRSAGTGNATMASPVAFTNTGTLEVQTGTFVDTHGGGWTSSGLLSVSSGATINLAGATLQAGTTFAGAGTLTMPGTTVVAANLTVTLPILLTGTLSGAGVLTLGAPMTWSGGWIGPGGGLTVGAGQTLTISSTNQKVLSGTSLTNNGSVTWTGGVITYDGIATIVNAAGKLWDIQGDLTINGNGNGTQTFINAGTLRRSSGTGNATMASPVALTNTGTLEVQTGTFVDTHGGGWTSSGLLSVSNGATINLAGATLQAGTTFAGAGTLTMPGTTVVAANLTVTLPILLTGTLSGAGVLTLGAPMTWSGGWIGPGGGLTVGAGQTLTISSTNQKVLSGTSLTNNGSVTWTGGVITYDGIATIVNAAGKLWDIQGDLTINGNGNGTQTFINAGTLRRSSGTGNATMASPVALTNTGTLEVQTGTFVDTHGGGWTSSGLLSVSSGATINLAGATLQAGTTFAGAGTLTMPGTTVVAANLTVTLPILLTGTLSGAGVLTLGAPMTWSSGVIGAGGGLTVGVGQTLTISSTNQKVLSGATLTNNGTVTWTGGVITLDGNATAVNAANGLWDVQADLTLNGNGTGAQNFTNAGILKRTGPIGTTTIGGGPVTFTNTGTIQFRLGGLASFDRIVAGTATLGGTLDVSLANGFVPTFRQTFAIMTYASEVGKFGAINGNGQLYLASYGATVLTLKHSVAPPNVELIRNGDFAAGQQFWGTFATPDLSYIVANVTGGVMQFYRQPPPPGTTNQATVFQETEAGLPSGAPLVAQFDLWNTSSVRKRVSAIVLDAPFGDLSVCTFWLAPNSPQRTYTIRTHATQPWENASVYFYAATAGSDGGSYQLDNVSLQYNPALNNDRTECVDPTTPPPPGGTNSANLIINGDFGTGSFAPWGVFGQISPAITNGVAEFYRPAASPAGVLLQITGQPMNAGQLMTSTFQLGNSSAVRKRVTVLLHDSNFTDLSACTFWLDPGQPLQNYAMRTFATQAWASATLSFYPATVDSLPAIRLDNATLLRTPSLAITGSECLEPGALPDMLAASAATAPRAGASVAPPATSTDGGAQAGDEWLGDGFRLVADGERLAWRSTAAAGETATLVLAEPIDLTAASSGRIGFRSWLASAGSRARVEVSTDGAAWDTVSVVPPSDTWVPVDVDLGAYLGERILFRFVFDLVAPAAGAPPDTWRIEEVTIDIGSPGQAQAPAG